MPCAPDLAKDLYPRMHRRLPMLPLVLHLALAASGCGLGPQAVAPSDETAQANGAAQATQGTAAVPEGFSRRSADPRPSPANRATAARIEHAQLVARIATERAAYVSPYPGLTEPAWGPLPTDLPEGYPPPPPSPAPTHRPRPTDPPPRSATPWPTMDLRGRLPEGATPIPGSETQVHPMRPDTDLRLLEYRTSELWRDGLTLWDAGTRPPALLFDSLAWLDAQGDDDILFPASHDSALRERYGLPYWIEDPEAETRDLVFLDVNEAPGTISLHLEDLPRAAGAKLIEVDLIGDGRDELLVTTYDEHEDGNAVVDERVYRRTEGAVARDVAPLPDFEQLTDIDGDGRAEGIERLEPEPGGAGTRWRVHRLGDAGWTPGEILNSAAPTEAQPVADGALPPLPSELWWWQDGAILRWPAEGGSLETVLAALPGDGYSALTGASDPDYRRASGRSQTLPAWRISDDGRWLARLERAHPRSESMRGDPEAPARDALSIRVFDRQRGGSSRLELDRPLESWALSPDGARVAVLVRVQDESGHAFRENPYYPKLELRVHRGDDGALLQSLSCAPVPGRYAEEWFPCGRGLSFSKDGESIAYHDPQGLHALRITDGLTRTLATSALSIYASRWTVGPWLDGEDRMLSRIGLYEGYAFGVVDAERDEPWPVPDSGGGHETHPSIEAVSKDGRRIVYRPSYEEEDPKARRTELRELLQGDVDADEPRFLLRQGPSRLFFDATIASLAVLNDGRVRYRLQSPGERFLGEAILERDPEGRERPLVVLPAGFGDGITYEILELWAEEGRAWLYRAPSGQAWIARGDGSALYDIGDLLADAAWLRWVPVER